VIQNVVPFRRCTGVPAIRLFCLPFAGGSAAGYLAWAGRLPDHVEVCPVELAGRGARCDEEALVSVPVLAAEVAAAITADTALPYAIFGHSMGGLLAYEVALLLRQWRAPEPVRLLVSSARSPDRWNRRARRHHLASDAELIDLMRAEGGTPPDLFDYPELLACALPALRADLRACETYRYAPATGGRLAVPVSVFGGRTDEEVTMDDLAGWRRHTDGPVAVHVFEGGHFYHQERRDEVLATVAADLDLAFAGNRARHGGGPPLG